MLGWLGDSLGVTHPTLLRGIHGRAQGEPHNSPRPGPTLLANRKALKVCTTAESPPLAWRGEIWLCPFHVDERRDSSAGTRQWFMPLFFSLPQRQVVFVVVRYTCYACVHAFLSFLLRNSWRQKLIFFSLVYLLRALAVTFLSHSVLNII